MKRKTKNIIALFLLLLSFGAVQAQVDDKGVTSTGKEIDCFTITPEDRVVNEYGAIVTQPRLTRNGKIITDDCCPTLDETSLTDLVTCVSISMAATIQKGTFKTGILQVFSDANYSTSVGEFAASVTDNKITAKATGLTCYTHYYFKLILNGQCEYVWTDSTRDATLEKATYCTVANIRTTAVSETDQSHEHLVAGSTTQIDSVYDHEGNVYSVVQIGTGANAQCWLKENMRCTTYPSDYTVALSNGGSSESSTTPYYYLPSLESRVNKNYTDAEYISTYGYLYNFAATMAIDTQAVSFENNHRGICPEGWHVPTDGEWFALEKDALSGISQSDSTAISIYRGSDVAKLTGGCDWISCDTCTLSQPGNYNYTDRNSFGFSALPSGYFNNTTGDRMGLRSYFWTATLGDYGYSLYRGISNSNVGLARYNGSRSYGFSVRCLRDNTGVTLGEVTKTDSTANSLSISADYTATKTVTSATICAYTNEDCTEPATPVCASSVEYTSSPITGTIEGLAPNTQYYVKVSVTTAGGTESKVAGPFGTKALTLTLTSNPDSATVKLCGQSSVTVTYTANLEGGTAETYSWSTSGGSATESTDPAYTVSYTTAGTYTVTCTAAGVSATKEVTIASDGTAATLGLCEDCNAGSITVKSGNCTSLTWVNNEDPTKTATTDGTVNTVLSESTSTPAGVYTVTGTNSDGCSITKTATLGKATAHPCTVTSLRAGTALDGGKYANKEYGTGTQLDSVSDHEGNVYRVVQIGEGTNAQCWLAENMRATTEPNGTPILKNPATWYSYSDPCAYYYGNSADNCAKYGCLYNFPGAMNISDQRTSFNNPHRGICPEGWHVSTDDEWTTLASLAGVGQDSGTGLGKLTGGCDWPSATDTASTAPGNYSYPERNSSGFSALPAGRYYDGNFYIVGGYATFWSALPDDKNSAYSRNFHLKIEHVDRNTYTRSCGCSVRCLRDNTGVTLGEVTKTDSTANSLSISADYTATKTVTSATICAYTNEDCTEPATPVCASSVEYTSSPIRGTIEGLAPNTQYYVKVSVTTAGGTESKVAGPFGTKVLTLTLTSNPASATVKLCEQSSVTVTYTANLEGGTAETYSWSTSGGSATESTDSAYTVSYTTAGTYTVTCTAAGVSATKEVTIASDGTAATLGLCEDCNAGSITVKSGNCTSLTWVNKEDPTKTATTDGTANTVLSESTSTPAGVYTVTGTNSDGCTVPRTATLGKATAHPCTVTSLRAGTALAGGKYANKEYGTGTQLDSVSDHEGNVYRVVQIGEGENAQCWLAENMRATTKPNGTRILQNPASESSYSSPRAYYYGNSAANYAKYGCLYNFPGAMNISDKSTSFTYPHRGICPEGWHVPSDGEWTTLTTYAGVGVGSGGTGAGKLAGGCDWSDSGSTTTPNSYAYGDRNSTGFSALPAGGYGGSGFSNVGSIANFWSSTPDGSDHAYNRSFSYNREYESRLDNPRYGGFSVRCLRD